MRQADIPFGKQLKKWREHKGLTQPALAGLLRVSQSTVGNYEGLSSKRSPALDNVLRVCDALGISIGTLMETDPPASGNGVAEQRAIYLVKAPADDKLRLRVQHFVEHLNQAINDGLDEKFLIILESVLAREMQITPRPSPKPAGAP